MCCLLQFEKLGTRRVAWLQGHNEIGYGAEYDSQLIIQIVRGSGSDSMRMIGFGKAFHTAWYLRNATILFANFH
jgi:hypothetical protein